MKKINNDAERPLAAYYPYIFLFGLYLVIYLPCLTNYSISIDDEGAFWRQDPSVWLSQGRIFSFFIEKYIIKQPTVTFFPELFFGVCACLSYILVLKAFKRKSLEFFDIISFGIFCAFPVWYFILEFYANIPAISVGILASGIGLFFLSSFFENSRKIHFIYSVLFFSISISCYQAYLFYVTVGIVSLYVVGSKKYEISFIYFIFYSILTLILSASLYLISLKILLNLYEVEVEYIQKFYDIGLLINNFYGRLEFVYNDAYYLYLSNKKYFVRYVPGVTLIIIFYFLLLFKQKKFLAVLMSAIMLFAPFVMHVTADYWPLRAQLAASFVIWFFAFYFYHNSGNLLKKISFAIVCITLLQFIYSISYYTSNQKLAYQYDVALASRLYDRIVEASTDPESNIVVDFYGSMPFETNLKKIPSGTSGSSFFEWDNGNDQRMFAFMRLIGYENLQRVTDDNVKARLYLEYLKMPNWPAKGSVKQFGNVVLVKLSNELNTQYQHIEDTLNVDMLPIASYIGHDVFSQAVNTADIIQKDDAIHSIGSDAQIYLNLDEQRLRDCKVLRVKTDLNLQKSTYFQIFYKKTGEKFFNERSSKIQLLNAGENNVKMTFSSAKGFENTIRIDPVNNIQNFQIHRVDISCLK